MNKTILFRFTERTSSLFLLCLMLLSLNVAAQDVGKWRRFEMSAINSSYTGNPFELEIDATFTHTASDTQIVMPGYYAGNDIWKVAFMPILLGEWTYVTSSSDPDLNGIQGSLICIESGHPGMLKADTSNPNKWKYADGPYVVPIGILASVMLDPASTSEFSAMADFLEVNNIHLLNFRLSENDKAFYNVSTLQMDLTLWDRLEQRMEILTEHGLGASIMLYTDDSGKPSFSGQSDAERLLIRYMVARLACYPIVMFNTGIDIQEYRNQGWVNWFGEQINALDPYEHPVSSRYGGGSGNYIMSGQTYNSVGDRNSQIDRLILAYDSSDDLPAANDDNWSEDLSNNINGHTRQDIRRAAWKATIAGGVAFHVRNNVPYCPGGITECDRYFRINQVLNDLDSAPWLGLINSFIQTNLGTTFGLMEPAPSLVGTNGGKYVIADPDRVKILYLLLGVNDTWDSGDGGPVTLKLTNLSGTYNALWFDTRTGNDLVVAQSPFIAGSDYTINPLSTDDWILYLTLASQGGNDPPPHSPTNLTITK